MYSYVEENYLKALLALTNEKGEVSTLALSQFLNIKMPTVNSMMKKFSEKGLVHYQSYKPFKLTEKGLKEAGLILRKHRLTEIYLVEKMGFSWEEVHEIAEQLEHVHSDKFFEKMDKLLDYPKFDPHGSPIPDVDGKLEWVHYKKLSECKVGDKVLLAAVMNSSREFLKYLNSKKLTLGLELEVIQIEEFDKSMTLKIISSKRVEVLSNLVTEKLLIKNN